jgi:Flp pilus assembly protein TadG
MSIAAIALFAMMGLAVDIGRMYITKNEAQSFADAGAIMAALKLNGSSSGIMTAAQVIANNPNRWELGTTPFRASEVTVEYAGAANSTNWITDTAALSSPVGLLFARVKVNPPVSLYFLAIVVPQTTTVVPATAIAGQIRQTTYSQGLFPFSPVTIAGAAAPDFGFVAGMQYALRSGTGAVTCSGEVDNAAAYQAVNRARGSANRGFWSTLESSGIVIRNQIGNDLQGGPISIGQELPVVEGDRQSVFTAGVNPGAVPTRVLQDTDRTSTSFAQYQATARGNGRRIVGVPIGDPYAKPPNRVVGFAEFFLVNVYPAGGSESYCAEYVGPWVQGTTTRGAGAAGGYKVRLIQ